MHINCTPEERKSLKKLFKKGFVYQRFKHKCGYKGNAYDEQCKKRVCCPQCGEKLKWVSLELEKIIFRTLTKICCHGTIIQLWRTLCETLYRGNSSGNRCGLKRGVLRPLGL